MDKKLKHLEFIQNVIDRQARNSFLLKGWAVTLVAGSFALAISSEVFRRTLFVYFLILVFWLLDAFYLWQEKRFRYLYDHVRNLKEENIDFNMDTKEVTRKKKCSLVDVFLSLTLSLFYLMLMIFTIIFFNWG